MPVLGKRPTSISTILGTGLAVLLVATGLLAAPAQAEQAGKGRANHPRHCARQSAVSVPGAERQVVSCLTDLTTAGTVRSGHTDPADWAGLHASGTRNPSGVPGIQVDGHFADTSTSNTNHGWDQDAQFVIRMPDRWSSRARRR